MKPNSHGKRQSRSAQDGRKKVAIIGSGVSGIAALWALNRSPHDVYLYEAADRLGGHTNTVEYQRGKYTTKVDTGFIVLNTATYPNFIAFLRSLGVRTARTEMTFGVSRDNGAFEWSGASLSALFAQKRNIVSPRFWRMIFDIVRFNKFAVDLLREDASDEYLRKPQVEESIGQYLERYGYSDAFRDDYLIPMTAAVWSTSPDKCTLDFPAVTLVRFLWNHHLLNTVAQRPEWLTLPDGSQSYIEAVMKGFPPNHVFLKTPVESLTNDDDGRVRLHVHGSRSEIYDHVIIATHGDQAYKLISRESDLEERQIMSGFQTSKNTAILHDDPTLMPRNPRTWAAWNFITESSDFSTNVDEICLTYNMNLLQHIPREIFGDVFVTLNPLHLPPPDRVQGRYSYTHPLYTAESVRAQKLLPRIQNTRGISYCGAWTRYGFHEDGFSSGIRVAQDHLGAKLPFKFRDSTYSRGRQPYIGFVDALVRLLLAVMQFFIVLVERAAGIQRGRQDKPEIAKKVR